MDYKYLNSGASFSTEAAARAFVAALGVSYKVKDIECDYKKNRFGIYRVWFMIEADKITPELSELVAAVENYFRN